MEEKTDGRLYSRVTRRCVAILKHIRAAQRFQLGEIASEIQGAGYPEFLLRKGERFVQMSAGRIGDYLSYLGSLKFIERSGKQYSISLTKPTSDAHWAQSLSDAAREQLAKVLNKPPGRLPKTLENKRRKLHRKGRVPTISALLADVGIEGTRLGEMFRWSLYLYTDGDACPFEIRQYPHLVPKGSRGK
jgi:hypothetical protein